ncbi:PRC-barrel domain-containing protein, partial [Phormidium pseudopriestleyi FRX01]
MALVKIHDFYPNYQDEIFGGTDIKGMDIYAGTTDEKIGTVYDILLDDTGRFRYLVVDTGFWIFGKKVLLPIGSARIDYDAKRIYAIGLVDKNQVEQLPEYDELQPIDYEYEERVRDVYRDRTAATGATAKPAASTTATRDRDSYNYDQEPDLYDRNDTDHRNLKLYEERLIANKDRYKAGEVTVGKRVETEV